jgi:bifunctional ADP-heptose synthase (sugar kinase/adenylyltransferase)
MKILVIGDSCTDIFIYGKCARMCPDAPVPIFLPTTIRHNGGMSANVADNIMALGAECHLICNLEKIEKTRYVDQKTNHMFLRVDSGEENIQRIDSLTKSILEGYDGIVISDYNKGFLERSDIQFICENHDKVFLDTKKILGSWCSDATFIKINEKEFEKTRHTIETRDNMIITLGENGCRHKGELYPVDKVEVKDMSGAGDTFLAGLAVNYLETQDIQSAIVFANTCATKVVQRRGVNVI